jgi:D-methionine transport system permease protein
MFDQAMLALMGEGILETLYMTLASTLLAYAFGLPLGVLLVVTDEKGILPCKPLKAVLDVIVNVTRSIPFLILMIAVIPFTRAVTGTSIGANATVVPLVLAAIPFVGRMVESSIREVDAGVVEAAQSMGATPFQIICRVMIPEALPSLVNGAAIATTTILGYSAMAGAVGGGGLGVIAINYGYHRYQSDVMLVTIILLVIIVQILQWIGTSLANRLDKKKV